jgi:hypothetical protein
MIFEGEYQTNLEDHWRDHPYLPRGLKWLLDSYEDGLPRCPECDSVTQDLLEMDKSNYKYKSVTRRQLIASTIVLAVIVWIAYEMLTSTPTWDCFDFINAPNQFIPTCDPEL